MKKKTPPTSAFARSAVLFGAGTSIIAKELGSFAKSQFTKKIEELKNQTRIEQIKLLTEALSHLKGSAMKLGQLLSFEALDYLPPEAIEILSRLQKNAAPVENSVLFEVLKSEIGSEKFEALKLEVEPLATASIGQVYRGILNDQDIVVKIQYPKVHDSIGSDMKLIRKLTPALMTLFGKNIDLNEILVELETVIKLETDYLREAQNLIQYKRMISSDSRYTVPTPLAEYSSAKCLTMTFEKGIHLKDWIAQTHSLEDRRSVGQAILDLYLLEFFQYGLVQTDPNLANFLVHEQDLKLVLLDCGAVLSYPPDFLSKYKTLMKILLKGEQREIAEYCISEGFVDSRESEESRKLFVNMVQVAVKPFDLSLQPFDFTQKDYSQLVQRSILDFSRAAKYSKPPREFIFLHRKLGGVFHILKMLELKMNLTPFLEQAMKP